MLDFTLSFASSPQIEVDKTLSRFGRVGTKESDQFALLLRLKFVSESEKPVSLRSLQVHFAGDWHRPSDSPPDRVTLLNENGSHGFGKVTSEAIRLGQRIPALDRIEGYAFFPLPQPSERWPKEIEFKLRATFPRRRQREISFTIKDRG